MTGIFTAAALDDAKQKAADAFGVPVSEISFKVLEEPKRSLLGGLFGKKEEYRIEANYTPAAVAEPEAEETAETAEPVIVEPETEEAEAAADLTGRREHGSGPRGHLAEDMELQR